MARLMSLKYSGHCHVCRKALAKGVQAWYHPETRTVHCVPCTQAAGPITPSTELDHGTAGASAQREGDRRHRKRDERIDQRCGILAGLVKFLSDDPQSVRAWHQGAVGERYVAQRLQELVGDQVIMLHDRKVPGTRANIDHIVISANGVWIVDSKRYLEQTVDFRDVGGWFRTDHRLYIGRRDRTNLTESLIKQVATVRCALPDESIILRPALAFVDANWPFLASPFIINNVWCTWPTKLAELIVDGGDLPLVRQQEIARILADRLPANR